LSAAGSRTTGRPLRRTRWIQHNAVTAVAHRMYETRTISAGRRAPMWLAPAPAPARYLTLSGAFRISCTAALSRNSPLRHQHTCRCQRGRGRRKSARSQARRPRQGGARRAPYAAGSVADSLRNRCRREGGAGHRMSKMKVLFTPPPTKMGAIGAGPLLSASRSPAPVAARPGGGGGDVSFCQQFC